MVREWAYMPHTPLFLDDGKSYIKYLLRCHRALGDRRSVEMRITKLETSDFRKGEFRS